MQIYKQDNHLYVSFWMDSTEVLIYVGQGNMSSGPDNNGLLYSSLMSPSLHCRAIQDVSWSGENKAPTNPTLLKDTVSEVVKSWFGQESLCGHTDLHVFHRGNLPDVWYCDKILDAYVQPYAAAVANDFILMDDNTWPHWAVLVEDYLENQGLEWMKWPAQFPDINPIEHVWDYHGRQVAVSILPPRLLHELEQGPICVWSLLLLRRLTT